MSDLVPQLVCTDSVAEASLTRIVRRLALQGFKWDTQIGDECSVASFALMLSSASWSDIAGSAEAMSRELLAVEAEIFGSRKWASQLGIPTRLTAVMSQMKRRATHATRIVRFDFHPTQTGWRVSEANTDVPGGYAESSILPLLMKEALGRGELPGSPIDRLIEALLSHVRSHRRVGLVSAPGYVEDQQVITLIGSRLRNHGVEAVVCRAEDVRWDAQGEASVLEGERRLGLDLIFRFYQGEWMENLPRDSLEGLVSAGKTVVVNPLEAVLTESKRLRALLPSLKTATPTLQRFVPPSYAPRFAHLASRRRWVFKLAYSNNGDAAFSHSAGNRIHRFAALRAVLHRKHWVAQKAFEPLPIETPNGAMYPCIGVYTINGAAAGIYGRISSRPIIDYTAKDVAVLVDA